MSWRRVKISLGILLAAAVAAGLWFARPMTIEQLCPGVVLDGCVGIQAYYTDDPRGDPHKRVELSPEDEAFSPLLELVREKKFRRSPFWWVPTGTKTHRWEDGDFKWEMMLLFEDVSLPDGSGASGALVHLNNFFGELTLGDYNGRTYPLRTSGQEEWVGEIMDIFLTAAENDSK